MKVISGVTTVADHVSGIPDFFVILGVIRVVALSALIGPEPLENWSQTWKTCTYN